MRTKAKVTHNAKTNGIPFNLPIENCEMMNPVISRHMKLNIEWIGLMRITHTRSDQMFIVDGSHKRKSFGVHCERLIPYPAH